MIWVTLWLAITCHIFPRKGQSTLTIFTFGVMYIQISFIAGAFPLTAHYAYRAFRRVVAFRTLGAIEFRVLFADVEVAVFRAELALAGAWAAVS